MEFVELIFLRFCAVAPHIISIKPVVEVYEGENAVLPCSASGNPGVNFRWLDINGKEIKNNEKLLIAHNGSLIVRNITLDDFRRYTCAPYNDIGEGKFGYTDLFVMGTLCSVCAIVFFLNLKAS